MQIEIVGPNLPRPLCDKGELHVHASGCAHLNRAPLKQHRDGWVQDLDSMQAVVESVYGPEAGGFYAESGIPEADWNRAWEEHGYVNEFHWAPCVADLPRYRPTPPDHYSTSVPNPATFAAAVIAAWNQAEDSAPDPLTLLATIGELIDAHATSETPKVALPSPTELQGWVALGFALGIMAESSRYGTDEQRAEIAEGFATYCAADGRRTTVAGFQAFESALLDWKYATR